MVLFPTIKQRLISILIKQIRNERDGNFIEKTQVRSAIQLLVEVGIQSKKIYETEFESVLLQETSEYFRQESNQLITDSSCSDYLKLAQKRLHEEYQRVTEYLCPTTEGKLIKAFLDEYIGERHSLTLLKMESSGLVYMIRNNQIAHLSLLF